MIFYTRPRMWIVNGQWFQTAPVNWRSLPIIYWPSAAPMVPPGTDMVKFMLETKRLIDEPET
jgi:hypothetical protein